MKLSMWAKKQGISYITAWRYFRAGSISNARQMPSGTILVDVEESIEDGLRKELDALKAENDRLKAGQQ